MKRILVLFFAVFVFSGLFSQESALQDDMNFFIEKLKIEEPQRATLSKILIRKQSQLAEIASLRTSDENLYRVKRRNAYSGAESSIKRLLNQEQMQHWHKYKAETRKQNISTIKALKEKNADKQDILDAQYGIAN